MVYLWKREININKWYTIINATCQRCKKYLGVIFYAKGRSFDLEKLTMDCSNQSTILVDI